MYGPFLFETMHSVHVCSHGNCLNPLFVLVNQSDASLCRLAVLFNWHSVRECTQSLCRFCFLTSEKISGVLSSLFNWCYSKYADLYQK